MGFNYGLERKKFEAEWAKLKKEYEEAGMSAEAIQEMYKYDLGVFNRKRADTNHEQPIDSVFEEDSENQALSKSSVFKKYTDKLMVNDTYSLLPKRYKWIDEIQNDKLYEIIIGLPNRDKEFLTYLVEGYTREEIAKMRGITVQSVNKKIAKFKNSLAEAVSNSGTTNV